MTLDEFKKLTEAKKVNNEELGKQVITRLEETKEAVKNVLSAEIKRVVPNVSLLPQYTKLGATDEDDFIEKAYKSNPGMLCDIIGKYTAADRMYSADDGFDDTLEKAYEKKNSKKTALKKRANEIIAMYNQILEDNENIINEMKQKIKDKEVEKRNLEEDIKDITKASSKKEDARSIDLREKYIKETTSKIQGLEKEIKADKDVLATLIKEQEEYKKQIKSTISEFENEFNDVANVEVGAYEKDKTESTLEDATGNFVTSGNKINTLIRTNDSPKVIAKKMLLDFKNMDKNDRTALINQYGYEDLLEMSKNLGAVGRAELRNILKRSIDEKEEIEIGKVTIKKGTIEDAILKNLVAEIEGFNKDISNKTPEEIFKFQDKIEKLNIIVLYESANTKRVTRFFRNFTSKGALISDLNQALKKFSNVRYERETKELKAANDLRAKIHVSQLSDQRPRKFLDKNKQNPISYDRSK